MQAIPYLLEFLVLTAAIPVLLRYYGVKKIPFLAGRPSNSISAFVALAFLIGFGQLLKLKSALYPFIPWNMYGGGIQEKTHSFFAFEWMDANGDAHPLVPARQIPALGYSRGDVYLRNRLKPCAFNSENETETSSACLAAQEALTPYFAALLQPTADAFPTRGAKIRILRTDIPYPLTSGKPSTLLLATLDLP